MKRLLLYSAILACNFLWCAPVLACDTVATARPTSDCVVMAREGSPGVWFSLTKADGLRKYKLEVGELKLQIEGYEQASVIQDRRINAYTEALDLKDSSLDTAKEGMTAFASQAREAREGEREAMDELHAWYRSPALWAGIGAGLVTALVIFLESSEVGRK